MTTETPQENYEAVSVLSEGEPRDLIQHGDAQERVWAAWALGLRLGGTGKEVFLEGLKQEPPSGTRMHLAVLLAGAGETKAVEALAKHDPSTQVRATAAQYLVKTSLIPNPGLAEFSERLRVDCSEVRRRTLIETPSRLGSIDAEVFARCAEDPDQEVRRLALAQMEQFPTELVWRLLEDRLQPEENPDLETRRVQRMVAGCAGGSGGCSAAGSRGAGQRAAQAPGGAPTRARRLRTPSAPIACRIRLLPRCRLG